MTQTTAPPATTAAPAPAALATAATAPAVPARRGRLRTALSRTPGRMRLAGVVAVLAALVAGLAGLRAGLAQSEALDAARADTAQRIGVQQARNALVIADATATNAFLVGGLEPPEQRARYEEQITRATHALTGLAGSNPQDADLLGEVTAHVATYTGLVEQARANNRQGFPVGAAYLDQASSVLRTDVLPTLDTIVEANGERVDGSFSAVTNVLWFLALCILGVLVVLLVQGWLARRTHRRLNAGLLGATVLLLLTTVLGAVVLGRATVRANDVRDGAYQAAVAASGALSLANDARSMESFTLIKRGSGQTFEEAYVTKTTEAQAQLAQAASTLDPAVAARLTEWTTAHAQIRALDDGGDWDGAVALAVDPDGAPQAAFTAFSDTATGALEQAADETRDTLAGAGGAAVAVGWLALVAGILAAVVAWRGISRRAEEYR